MSPQADPGRARLPAAAARWTTGRCGGRSSSSGSARPSTCRPPRGRTSCAAPTATWSSRSSGRPGWSTPRSIVKPTKGQIDDLIHEIRLRTERNERVLVTTLTKKMAEDLTDYLLEHGHPGPLPALRGRHPAPHRAAARAAAGRVRRAGRHQPAARGPRPARGVAGGDPRRRQGGLPALGHLADPDHRPRRPQRVRPGAHVRRHGSRLDGSRRSTRPTGAGPSRSPTTPRTASTRSRCARRSPTSPTSCRREDADTDELLGGGGRKQSRGKAPVPGSAARAGRRRTRGRPRERCPRASSPT